MNYIFAKLFEEYKRKNDPAEFTITLYISIIYFFIFFGFYLPISEIVNKRFLNNNLKYNKTILTLFIFLVFGLIIYFTYYKYIKKKHIYTLVKKYKKKKINKAILYFLVIFLPAFLLLIAGTLTVLLKGGTILNYRTDGLIFL